MARDKWGREYTPAPKPPHYGGNHIPQSYLDRHNAETRAWLAKVDGRAYENESTDQLPMGLRNFVEEL